MARGKNKTNKVEEKEVVAPEVVEEETTEVVEAEETAPEPKEEKPIVGKVSITATFRSKTEDGDTVINKFVGSGANAGDAIAEMRNIENDDEFPTGLNRLVNVTVKAGTWEYSRALAPHVVRDIFDNRNVQLFKTLLGLK